MYTMNLVFQNINVISLSFMSEDIILIFNGRTFYIFIFSKNVLNKRNGILYLYVILKNF